MRQRLVRSPVPFPIRAAVLVAAVLAGIGAAGATIRVELTFDPPTVSHGADGSVLLAAPGCVTFNEPGLPLLPARRAVVLLPPGETVTAIRVVPEGVHAIEGRHLVAPAQRQVPIGTVGPHPRTEPDPSVYGSDALYPAAAARLVTEQKGWGHGLAYLRVSPVSYRPALGALSWYERVIVEVDTALPEGADALSVPRLRRSARALDRLSSLVVNPEDLKLYEPARPAPLAVSALDPGYYPYVIVTREEFREAFRPVADFQSSRGLRARIVTIEELGGIPGANPNLSATIREFLIDAYESWGTEFVLLGGNDDVVPAPILNAPIEDVRWPIAADCYYEGLDGTWDDDGDHVLGEPGEEDLVGEIAVGRTLVDDLTELENWRHKNEMYTERPVVSQVRKGLFLGEVLDDVTWGDDMMEEIRVGSETCGYATAGYPVEYDRRTLYDRDGVWDKFDLISLLNEGFPSVHHIGHAYWLLVMRLEAADLAYLTNDGVGGSYVLGYTVGCAAGAFDLEETCICESLVNDAHGSAAMVCNSRNGYYEPGSLCGSSQHFHRQFVDARYGEAIVAAGPRNVDSKADLVWMLDEYMRYVHYGLNLLGDPALPQWDAVLGTLELEHGGKYSIAAGSFEVTVNAGGVPVPGATVTMYSADFSVWASGETDAAGAVVLEPDVSRPTTLYLKAVKADYLPATGEVRASRK